MSGQQSKGDKNIDQCSVPYLQQKQSANAKILQFQL